MRLFRPTTMMAAVLALAGALALVSLSGGSQSQEPGGQGPQQAATVDGAGIAFVGSEACGGCHETEQAAWLASHHRHAMEHSSQDSVRGDFAEATFEMDGERLLFYRDGERFLVRTLGADGLEADFEILFTFGWEPLQQYLIAAPGGRLQALDVAWDSERGRWIDLYPEEIIPPGDPLHWTGLQQNWNFACADCHSTGLRRNYDPASDSFSTTWAEVTIGCESCHGAGALHLAWAAGQVLPPGMSPDALGLTVAFPDPGGGWGFAEGAAIAQWQGPARSSPELAVCGPCHARRRALSEAVAPAAPLLDAWLPSLLDAGLYRPDGRQQAEVYILGSFLQSKMAAAGVTCSDCHEPHGAALVAEGNALCAQCHQPSVFDGPGHHHHDTGSEAAQCVSCHMPADGYMVVDPRRDHGFHAPSAALAAVLGVVDACSGCHANAGAWDKAEAAGWWALPDTADLERATAIALGRAGGVGAAGLLAALAADPQQPPISRATALALLGSNPQPSALPALLGRLRDDDALLRLGAVRALAALPPADRYRALAPLIGDPVKAVRLEVASALSEVPLTQLPPAGQPALAELFAEMLAVERLFLDRPESHYNIANHLAQQGDALGAERAYRQALARDPSFVPAYVNLAELQRASGGESLGIATLRRGLAAVPAAPALHYALGLALYRQGDKAGALAELAEARAGDVGYAYAYALALEEGGERGQAIAVLEASLATRPNDREVLYALVYLYSTNGEVEAARRHARHLAALEPEDPAIAELLRRMGG